MVDPLQVVTESVLAQNQIRRENAHRARRGRLPLTPEEEQSIISRLTPSKPKAAILWMPSDYEEACGETNNPRILQNNWETHSTWYYVAVKPTMHKDELGKLIPNVVPHKNFGIVYHQLLDLGYEPIECYASWCPYYERTDEYFPVEGHISDVVLDEWRTAYLEWRQKTPRV